MVRRNNKGGTNLAPPDLLDLADQPTRQTRRDLRDLLDLVYSTG